MVTDATEENEVCQLMIWIGLPAMPGRVKGWLVADQPASKYSTQLPPPPVVPQPQLNTIPNNRNHSSDHFPSIVQIFNYKTIFKPSLLCA